MITGYKIEVSAQRQPSWDDRDADTDTPHHLRPHRPFPRHHPPLPRLGDQLGRHRRRLQRRRRHHRRRRARAGPGGGDGAPRWRHRCRSSPATRSRAQSPVSNCGAAAATTHHWRLAQGQLPARLQSSDGNYVESWGYFKPGVTRDAPSKGADYDVGRSPGTVTARVTGPSTSAVHSHYRSQSIESCTDNYMVGNPSNVDHHNHRASMQVTASASSSDRAGRQRRLVGRRAGRRADPRGRPDPGCGRRSALLGEQALGEAELAALDRPGQRPRSLRPRATCSVLDRALPAG